MITTKKIEEKIEENNKQFIFLINNEPCYWEKLMQ